MTTANDDDIVRSVTESISLLICPRTGYYLIEAATSANPRREIRDLTRGA